LLLEEGLIDQQQLQTALDIQKKEGGFLGRILVKQGFVSQEAVASALVKQCKIPYLSLSDYDVGSDVQGLIPEETCRKYHLIPIDKLGRILTVAMVDPLDLEALQAIRATCPELRIKPILCSWEHYSLALEKLFSKDNSHPSGQKTLTAESLGLRAQAPRQHDSTIDAVPKPAASEAAAAAPAASAAPAAAAGIDPAVITSALQSSNQALLGALREGFNQLAQQLPATTGTSPSPEAYAAALKEALRDAIPQPVALPAGAAPALDTATLARTLQDSVGGAIQEALATVMVKMRAEQSAQPGMEHFAQIIAQSQAELAEKLTQTLRSAQPTAAPQGEAVPPAPPAQSPEVLAAVIRDSVGGAMQEALAGMLVQMRAIAGKNHDGEAQQIIEALRETQVQTNQRLEQIAETALQSVQQAAMLVEHAQTHENQDGSRLTKRAAAASVTPFLGSTTTIDDPQVHEADQEVYNALESDQPSESFTFDNFIAGKTNAFTYKAAQAVAAKPGAEYNPFFIFGSVGLGKTHLISAIGNAIHAAHPAKRVGYVSASHFSRKLSEAAKAGALDAFRENYCCWDVLILDDIQFLGGRVEAQEEFFHIFNTLHRAQRQIIIASDKAPDRLGLLEKRLVSRFASGIVAELKAPEWEARVEILRQQAKLQSRALPDEILHLVAMKAPKDIRKMSGSLRKIIAFSELTGQEISCESANEILSHLVEEQAA
jgi:chromosomal replication initiator protein DnaA